MLPKAINIEPNSFLTHVLRRGFRDLFMPAALNSTASWIR